MKCHSDTFLFLFVMSFLLFFSCDKEVSTTQSDISIYNGELVINSNPQGAVIYFGNDNTGRVTPDTIRFLQPGVYYTQLRLAPFFNIIDTIVINDDSQTEVFIDFLTDTRNYGILNCTSEPSNSLIFINDSSTGKYTPVTIDHLWAGTYTLRFSSPQHRDAVTTISITGQQTKDIYLTLQDTSFAVDYNSSNSSFPGNNIKCVAVDMNNAKWVATVDNGVVKIEHGLFTIYNVSNSLIPTNTINTIFVDQQNNKWIGAPSGVVRIDENMNWTLFNTTNSNLPNNYISNIISDNNGTIWFSSDSPIGIKALSKFDGNDFIYYDLRYPVITMTVDTENRIWLGLEKGFKIFENETWRDDIVSTYLDSLVYNPIESMACDSKGNIIIGAGWSRSGFSAPMGIYIFDWNKLSGLPSPTTYASHINVTQNGDIWISCLGKYLFDYTDPDMVLLVKFDSSYNSTSFTQNSHSLPGFNYYWSALDLNGDLWIASRRTGIVKFKTNLL